MSKEFPKITVVSSVLCGYGIGDSVSHFKDMELDTISKCFEMNTKTKAFLLICELLSSTAMRDYRMNDFEIAQYFNVSLKTVSEALILANYITGKKHEELKQHTLTIVKNQISRIYDKAN